MKRKLMQLTLVSFILALSFTSCDKVSDALQITLEDVLYAVEVPVEFNTLKSDIYTFSGSGAFDPNAEEGDEAFGKIIQQVNVKSVSIMVSNLSAPSEVIIEDAVFTLTDHSTGKVLSYVIDGPLTLLPYAEFTIDESTPNFSVVSDILKDLHGATIAINGKINQNEIVLSFMYTITADITLGV